MSKRKWTDKQFIEAIKTSLSYAEVKREVLLMMKNISSHYVILLQTKIVLYM